MSSRRSSSKLIRKLLLSFRALFRSLKQLLKRGKRYLLPFFRGQLPRNRTAGFVLPTTVLVLLVVALFAGALISRSGDQAENVIRTRESQRIDSIAAPAVERAKAKIEYIFNRDPRFPTGVPSEKILQDLLLYVDTPEVDPIKDSGGNEKPDPYLLPDETRIDLDGDGTVDNAWTYETDLDGDGTNETVAYSILLKGGVDSNGNGDIKQSEGDLGYWSSDQIKAQNLITRTGPINIKASEGTSADCTIPSLEDEQGWFAADATSLRKNLQVNVFVENENDVNKSVAALEFQQDRQLDKGNKFGVWFRYDLLIHPGPPFRLNGAVHTDGNLFTWNNDVNFYLVSSPDSCIYSEDANIIEITQIQEGEDVLFQGQAIANGTERVDLYDPTSPETGKQFKPGNDSVDGTPNKNTGIYKYSLDPLVLFTEDRLVSRDNQNGDGTYDTSVRDSDWGSSDLASRIRNNVSLKPYVDDLYRADDRWGPKPKYGKTSEEKIPNFNDNGALIPTGKDRLLELDPPAEFPAEVGLDGYWERRAYVQGLRIIVGQRLELGNPSSWTIAEDRNTDGDLNESDEADPLYPIINNSGNRTYEKRQLKTLQDNLAAVQATTVYHYQHEDGDFPLATLATTAHPGTVNSRANSTTFNQQNIGGADFIITNFLEGQGTNGWEFEPPGSVDGNLVTTQADFATLVDDSDSSLRLALENLAHFAGDPDGAFPPKQENGGNLVHPYPNLTMWGDYSNLRRAMDQLDIGDSYDDLSIADQTTILNAAANLGMLAYNIELEEAIYNEELDELKDTLSNSEVNFGEQIKKAIEGPTNRLIYNYITNAELKQILLPQVKQGLFLIGKITESQLNATGENDAQIDSLINDFKQAVADNEFGDPPSPKATQLLKKINLISDPSVDDNSECEVSGEQCIRTPQEYVDAISGTTGTEPTTEQLQEYFGYRDIFTAQNYRDAFFDSPGGGGVDLALLIDFVEAATGENEVYPQIERDREFGFKPGLPSVDGDSQWNPETGISENDEYYLTDEESGKDVPIRTGCDPDIFDPVVVGSGGGLIKKKVGLALAMCDESLAQTAPPRFPSLYYLFPVADHVHDGGPNARQPNEDYNNNGTLDTVDEIDIDSDGFGGIDDLDGNGVQENGISEDVNGNGVLDAEPYIADSYIFQRSGATITGVNQNVTYQVIDDDNGNGEEDSTEDSIGAIALPPKPDTNSFVLPTTGGGDFDINNQITDPSGSNTFVSLLDKGMYNGRQQMSVRHMNLDLGLLKDDTAAGGEPWIPNSGIVYAFREDAIREDGIARPRATDWGSCDEDDKITDGDCAMDPTVPRDPPKNDENGVSAKPVDYATDPDRRPHAFRLANGADLGRSTTDRGLSFITDNPVAMLGDFNLHTKEEFTDPLNINNYNNFYSRSNLETGFARAGSDQWRPTEVLSDAITILSNDYCDGVIEDAIRGNNDGCNGSTSSYRDTKLDDDNGKNWSRSIQGDAGSPIKLDRDGKILYNNGGTISQYDDLNGSNSKQGLNNASETTINTVFVSGLTPTREGESYGGLHNFPRFNENWGSTNLVISGSFVQLNFSTYDTASYDHQDTFKSSSSTSGGADIPYYRPPNRRWGYDVALQYNPPGPIVERLLSQSGLRSEIYQEIEATDPYIQQLCKAATSGSSTCP